jgi:hypothetical protein
VAKKPTLRPPLSKSSESGTQAKAAESRLGNDEERELRSRWKEQFTNVWFSAPAKTRLEREYLNAEMRSPGYLWAAGYINVDCSPTHLEWTDVGQARGYYVATHWVVPKGPGIWIPANARYKLAGLDALTRSV